MKNLRHSLKSGRAARISAVILLAVIAVVFSACEGPILVNVEDDVFRATSEKFAELVLRNGLNVIDPDSQVAFDDAAVGGLPREESFSIQNAGDYALELTSITFSGDGADSFTLEEPDIAVLQPDGTTTFSVSFTPTSPAGLKRAKMNIAYRGGLEESTTFDLLGEAYGGELPELKLEFSSNAEPIVIGVSDPLQEVIADDPVPFGTSVDYTFTINNLGNQNLDLTEGGAKIVGSAGIFTVSNAGIAAPVDTSTTFTVTADYSTAIPRGPKTVTIAVPNNDDTEGDIQFKFTVYAQAPEVNVRLEGVSRSSGSSASFSRNWEWDGDLGLTFRVYNENSPYALANAPLTFTTATPVTESEAGTDFVLSGTPTQGTTVAAGSSRSFTLTFQPAADGNYSTIVTIRTDDPNESSYTVTVNVTAGPPDLQVSAAIGGDDPTLVADGDTVYLPNSSSELVLTIENAKGASYTTPLQFSIPKWHDDGDGSDFLGLPFENDTWRADEQFAFEIADLKALDDGYFEPGKGADVRLRFNSKLSTDLFWKERVELHSNTFGDEVFTFFLATGNPYVLGFGHVNGQPAVWQLDSGKEPGINDFAIFERRGEILGAYLARSHPLAKDYAIAGPGVRFYGTVDTGDTYEAAWFDFDLTEFKFLGFDIVREIAEQDGHSAIMGVASDGEIYRETPVGVYAGGFQSGDSLAPTVDPGRDWFAVAAAAGFVTRGFLPDDDVTPLDKNQGVYDVAARVYDFGGGSWNAGTNDGRAYAWPNPGFGENLLVSGSDNAVLAASGGTYFTLLGGYGTTGETWILDYSDPKSRTVSELSTFSPLSNSRVFAVDEKGVNRLTMAGVDDAGEPVLWTDQGQTATVLGRNDGGIAFGVMDHTTGYVVGGVYADRPMFWSSTTLPDDLIVLSSYLVDGKSFDITMGEVNAIIPYAAMDFYRWEK